MALAGRDDLVAESLVSSAPAIEHSGQHAARSGRRSRTRGHHACRRTIGAAVRRTARSFRATRPAGSRTACRDAHRRIPRRCTCRCPAARALRPRESPPAARATACRSLLTAAPTQDHHVTDLPGQLIGEPLEVLVPFRQDQRRSACPHSFNHVVTDGCDCAIRRSTSALYRDWNWTRLSEASCAHWA